MQATLEVINEDLHKHRSEPLVPKLEAGLNEQQLQAFRHDAGPALVLAAQQEPVCAVRVGLAREIAIGPN